jgi:hypothetical protein
MGCLKNSFVGARAEADFNASLEDDLNATLKEREIRFIRQTKNIKQKFVWFPKKCRISKKMLWMQFAYRVRRTMFEPFALHERIETRWYSGPEFTMLLLRN